MLLLSLKLDHRRMKKYCIDHTIPPAHPQNAYRLAQHLESKLAQIWIPKDSWKDDAILAQMPCLAEIRPNPAIASRVWMKPVLRIQNRPKKLETHGESLDEKDSKLAQQC